MIKTQVILFAFCVFFSSCRKKVESCDAEVTKSDRTSTPVDSVLKKDFFFQPGTYWVYNVEGSTQQDSVFVISSSPYVGSYVTKDGSGCSSMAYYSYNTIGVYLSGETEPTKYFLTGRSWHFSGDFYSNPTLLKIEAGQIQADSMQYFSTLDIDGISYNKVFKIKYYPQYYENRYSRFPLPGSYFYMNDSIGILRKDLLQPDSSYKRYYLKRYHLVK